VTHTSLTPWIQDDFLSNVEWIHLFSLTNELVIQKFQLSIVNRTNPFKSYFLLLLHSNLLPSAIKSYLKIHLRFSSNEPALNSLDRCQLVNVIYCKLVSTISKEFDHAKQSYRENKKRKPVFPIEIIIIYTKRLHILMKMKLNLSQSYLIRSKWK
jgi:hypothetical protein